MKIRHVLLALFAVLAIAFMQPLVTFIGGLTLLLGAGALIFRDLTPAGQDAVEQRVLGWLHQARTRTPGATRLAMLPDAGQETDSLPAERLRRSRARPVATAVEVTNRRPAPPG